MAGRDKNDERKVNIAFVLLSLCNTGGSERVVFDLVRKLNKTLFRVVIVGFCDGPLRMEYERIGAKVHIVNKKTRYDVSFILKLRGIFIEERIEIVNPHHFSPILFSFLATRGSRIKFVYTEHSKWQLIQLGWIFEKVNAIILFFSDAVIAISRQIESYLIDVLKVDRMKVRFVTNGVDIDRFYTRDKVLARKRFGVGPSEKVIGMVANIRPEKNHKFLISAFNVIAEQVLDLRLVFAGSDIMNGEIQKCAAESINSDRIMFLGVQEDIPELLCVFDVFCLPSLYEGLPLSILEAMAAGTPVVGTNVIGINEVVSDGENGILVPLGDTAMLAETLFSLLNDEELGHRLTSNARRFVLENYSLDDKTAEYERLFLSLVSRS
jgi:glycosyltransferase involved in cell wall biosynthesis